MADKKLFVIDSESIAVQDLVNKKVYLYSFSDYRECVVFEFDRTIE
jgi:hypothetical protein